jgi:gliding motility-associated-like protein
VKTLSIHILRLTGLLFLATNLQAQQINNAGFLFEENKNQHPAQVKYKAGIGEGLSLFMEKDKFTFLKYDPLELEKIHDEAHEKNTKKSGFVHLHAFQMSFLGANPGVELSAADKSPFYYNYFRGNNPATWASEVYSYQHVNYKNIYQGIDIHAYSQNNFFKYDFVVKAGINPDMIQMKITGADDISVVNNTLIIKTSVGEVVENIPYTYQIIDGEKKEVECNYVLSMDGIVSFEFPNGYNNQYPLIIDPVLIAASYSGGPASCTTYGHCATYDVAGNIYTGGECFDPGYPTTAGAFQSAYAGVVDIAIGKLNPNGSALVWASYVGGADGDIPNSLFVNNSQEIYILGATSSNDYPTTAGCFDNSYNGLEDIVVTHFNSTGTALLGSTYVGGSGDDGGGWVPWSVNGHDGMRGEIIVDAANNAWIGSFTSSANFPTSAGTYDNNLNGTWDACAFRLSPNTATLQWSTYLGGNADDGAYGLRLNTAGELYLTGVSASADFPATPGAYDVSHNGGSDAYIARFNPGGATLSSCTFLGTAQSDIGYFMDIDIDENVYIYGISQGGGLPITPGVYNNPGSGNFISKFNPTLSTLMISTQFGDGLGYYLEPEAFMVDKCKNIYISGFGGNDGYPTTANGLYTTTAAAGYGSCYFMVLEQDAASLLYGSFYFGSHVDGGTSRFDPNGSIYQGICIGSGGATTPPWAYKDNTNAPGWDMYVVKIDFEQLGVVAHAGASPSTSGCAPFTVNFTNNSNNALSYYWDFDDAGDTSTLFQPSHTFNNPGTYDVMLIAIDSSTCNVSDTTYLTIQVGAGANVLADFDYQLFNCGTYTFQGQNTSTGSQTYSWNFGDGNTSTQTNPSHNYAGLGPWVVTLIATDTICNGSDTISMNIQFTNPTAPVADFQVNQQPNCDFIIADFLNNSQNCNTYLWNFGDGNTSTLANPSHTYSNPGNYNITLTVYDTVCNQQDQMVLQITLDAGLVINVPNGEICDGQPAVLDAGAGFDTYLWSTGDTTSTTTVTQPGTYTIQATLGNCTETATVVLTELTFNPAPDTPLVCPGNVVLHAGAGSQYVWSTGATTESISVSNEVTVWYHKLVGYCLVSDTIVLRYRYKSPDVFIPNSFTPNEDGLNEIFYVVGADKEDYELMIFDRWGELIFYSDDPVKGWDGRYKTGKLVPQGSYVWKLFYKNYCLAPTYQTKFGHINVIR